jgi:hypothetical protein
MPALRMRICASYPAPSPRVWAELRIRAALTSTAVKAMMPSATCPRLGCGFAPHRLIHPLSQQMRGGASAPPPTSAEQSEAVCHPVVVTPLLAMRPKLRSTICSRMSSRYGSAITCDAAVTPLSLCYGLLTYIPLRRRTRKRTHRIHTHTRRHSLAG